MRATPFSYARFVMGELLLTAFAAEVRDWTLWESDEDVVSFERQGGPGMDHWLTVYVELVPKGFQVNTIMSARHVAVDELAGELFGRDRKVAQYASSRAHRVRLDGPSRATWPPTFPAEEVEPTVRRVLAAASEVRLPTTLADLIEKLEGEETNIGRANLAVAHALNGDLDRAAEALTGIQRWVDKNSPDGMMAGFLTAFRERFPTD